jgi:hypothetical protein
MMLRISDPETEGVFQASKWLKIQVLLDGTELAELIETLQPFWMFQIGGIGSGEPTSQEVFLNEYQQAVEALQKGIVPKSMKAMVFVDDLNALWLQKVGDGKYLTKISKPVLHVQTHYFTYSEGTFRSMSMGTTSIFWGLQFSFPGLYQDPKTMEFHQVKEGALFRKIQLWTRAQTRATPFLIEARKMNSPMRIGKKCFSWINSHPQLILQNIQVVP